MNRRRIEALESVLAPPLPRILAALAWNGTVRAVLIGAAEQPAPEGMTTADLPSSCVVFESNPQEEAAWLYRGVDGKPYCQRVLGVNLDEVLGRNLQPKRKRADNELCN